jgi:TonB family protein
MNRMLAVVVFLVCSTGASLALVPGGSVTFLDQRIAEVDASILRIKVDLLEDRVPEAQRADFLALQKSLETEKALLMERKAVLLRLEPATAAAPAAPAPAPAAPAPPPSGSVVIPVSPPVATTGAPAAAASANPLTPVNAPKVNMPDAACQQRLSGWVGLEFAILPSGAVADVKVTAAEPAGAFDAAAIEAVSGRTYPPRALPMKMKEKMFMSFADCRAAQLAATAAPSAGVSQEHCPTLSAQARATGAPFDPIESGRAVLAGGAQAYSAPNAACQIAGKMLKAGTRLTARMEYKEFSLVSNAKGADEAWVRSNQLKDVAP